MNKYDAIINLSRPKSKYPKMSLDARAAQFAPFAALTGYGEAIDEVGRITDKKKILSEEEKDDINKKINYIDSNIKKNFDIIIIYYVKDKKKDGGKYLTIKNIVKKIDKYNNLIILVDNLKIAFDDIYYIEII